MKSTLKYVFLIIPLFFIFAINSFAQTKKAVPTPTPIVSKSVLPQMLANKEVIIKDPVKSDLFAAGSQVSLEAPVSGDVYVAGGQVDIKNTVGQNLIVAGGTVNISGIINKNLIIAGGEVNLDKNAVINGYLLAAGGRINVASKINGPAKLAGDEINFADTSLVDGNLELYSQSSNISNSAKINGDKKIVHVDIPQSKAADPRNTVSHYLSAFNLFRFIANLLILLLFVRILGPKINSLIDYGLTKPWLALVQGFVGLIIIPFAVILLMVTVVGIPLGIITGILYGLSLYLSLIVSGIFVGRWFSTKKWVNNENIYFQSSLGYLILFLVSLIPVLGGIVGFIAFLFGLGIIFQWQKSLFAKTNK